jgi:hypothetical protein
MIEITKENISSANFVDKQWKNPSKFGFKNKLSTNSKIIMYLLGTVAIFTIANATLIYSFYKILIKL